MEPLPSGRARSLSEPTTFSAGAAELPDAEVVRRVIDGEVELFEILMRRHNQRVYRVGRAVLADDALAEDLAQEAWVRVFERLEQFEGRAVFSTWLTKIVLHEAWARARKAGRLRPLPDDPAASDGFRSADPNPEERMLGIELRTHLESAIEGLPAIYREVLVLRDVEDLSTAETADLLRITESAVKVRLHRARAMLKRSVSDRVGDASREFFPFRGERCDRLVHAVMARVAGSQIA
jgi:RNA polymerase sigma-70 factor, ECF subfamily